MAAVYAIGDIHGQALELDRVLGLIHADGGEDADIVFLGDYTDRGPDSRGVLDRLISGRQDGRNWTFLKGNHDRMFELFMRSPPEHDPYMMVELYWLHPRLGGDTTLGSYGVDASGKRRVKDVHAEAIEAVPQAHQDFLKSLSLCEDRGALFFAHAGVRPGTPLYDQSAEDLLWIRQEFHESQADHGALIVHGHTPVDRATHFGNRVNLDTGAGFGRPLSAAAFEDGHVFLLTDEDRKELRPAQRAT